MSTSFAEALAPLSRRMPRVVQEHEVLRVAGWLPGDDPEAAARVAAREVLRWAQRRAGKRLPPEAWEGESFALELSGRDPSAIRVRAGSSDLWAFRVNDPDKTVARRAWTTEVVLGHQHGEYAKFSARLLAATPEQELSIEPAVPGFVRQVAEKCGLKAGNQSASHVPIEYRNRDDAEFLIDHLLDPQRVLPTFVLTTVDGDNSPLLEPSELLGRVVGLAHVAVAHTEACWHLTERFGKRLSVFGGAARVYLPGFEDTADPYAHRLVLADTLTSQDGAERTKRWLSEMAAQASKRRTRLGVDVLPFAAIRSASLEARQAALREKDAADTDKLAAALEQIEALQGELEDIKSEQDYYLEEYEKERERAEAAEVQAQKAGWRLQQLMDQLRSSGSDPDDDLKLPSSWAEFAEWCDAHLAGRLVLAPSARRGVRRPDFMDFETAARSLHWLATIGLDRFREGGGSLKNETILEGVQNAPCGADAYEFDWNGRRFLANWHVKNGGNTRDPVRCLRVYYCFDPQWQQIVVSDMPGSCRGVGGNLKVA